MIHTMRGAGYVLKPAVVRRGASRRSPRAWSSPRSRWWRVRRRCSSARPRRWRCTRYLDRPARPRRAGVARPRSPPAAAAPTRPTATTVGRRRPTRHPARRRPAPGILAAATSRAAPVRRSEHRGRRAGYLDALDAPCSADVPADGARRTTSTCRASASYRVAGRPTPHGADRRRRPADRRRSTARSRSWSCWEVAARRCSASPRPPAPAWSSYAASCGRCARSPPTAHTVAELPLASGRDRPGRAGARAPHRRAHRGRPGRRRAQHAARPRRVVARPRGTAASSRCASSSPTPPTSCARRWPRSRATPSWPAAAPTTPRTTRHRARQGRGGVRRG